MRVIKEFNRDGCKITLFAWNNRYIIKLEEGLFEQTFKIDQFDVTGEDELLKLIDDEFISEASKRFDEMARSLHKSLGRGGA